MILINSHNGGANINNFCQNSYYIVYKNTIKTTSIDSDRFGLAFPSARRQSGMKSHPGTVMSPIKTAQVDRDGNVIKDFL